MVEAEHTDESGVELKAFESKNELNIVFKLDKRHLDLTENKHKDYRYTLLSTFLRSYIQRIHPQVIDQLYIDIGDHLKRDIDRRRRVKVLICIIVYFVITRKAIYQQKNVLRLHSK